MTRLDGYDPAERRFGNWLLALSVVLMLVAVPAYADQLYPYLCDTCQFPDLPWYMQAWCWLNC